MQDGPGRKAVRQILFGRAHGRLEENLLGIGGPHQGEIAKRRPRVFHLAGGLNTLLPALALGKVATQFGVSPMPVREALNRLAEAGIVTLQKKKSAIVNTLSGEDLSEIQQIRLNLESMAVELACRSMDDNTLAYLEILHQAYLESFRFFSVEEVLRINREFHFAIYGVTRMPRLLHLIKGLWDQISPYYHILLRNKGHLYTEKHAGTHGELLKNLQQGNVEGSVRALRADLNNAAELIITEFRKYRGFGEAQPKP